MTIPLQTRSSAPLRAFAEMLAMVAVATLAGLLLTPRIGTGPVDLLYLVPVMAAATLYGGGLGTACALISALAYNFFFTEPLRTFQVHSTADIATVLLLLGVALVVSRLAAMIRVQAERASASAARNATIAGYAARLLPCVDQPAIAEVVVSELSQLFACNASLLLSDGDAPRVVATRPIGATMTPSDLGAAALTFERGEVVGRGSSRLHSADWLFFPAGSGDRVLAAIGLARDDGRPPVAEDRTELLQSLLDTTAIALERASLAGQMQDVTRLRERDQLRGALLSSVGHDLRTPLTAISAASSELRETGADPALLGTLDAEAGKLRRYIGNLLDMARIEAGSIRLQDEPVDLIDAVAAVRRDLAQGVAPQGRLLLRLQDGLPLLRTDVRLLHHALLNIVDNALRYSPQESRVTIEARQDDDGVFVDVHNDGVGFPDPDAAFERFVRIGGSDRTGGAGLGLGIVAGFARAMGLTVAARNGAHGGATVGLHFPAALIVDESALLA